MSGLSPWMRRYRHVAPEMKEVVSRSEYREIMLARMAAGDLYAAEELAKVRKVDMMFDVLREKPIYGKK